MQTVSGTYAIDLDLASEQTDRVTATGSADLAGLAQINAVNSGYARPGTNQHIILSGAGGVTDSGLALDVQPSAVIKYDLLYPNATDVVLDTDIDFAPDGLNKNQTAIGNHVNDIQLAGSSESFAPIAEKLVGLPDNASLDSAYQHMLNEISGGLVTETVVGSMTFNNSMNSCRQRDGAYRFITEGECLWLRFEGGNRDRENTSQNSGYDLETVTLAGGYQWKLAGDRFLGIGLSYMDAVLDSTLVNSDGSQLEGGIIIKQQVGANMFSGSISAGYGRYDTDRIVRLPTAGVSAYSDQDIYFSSVHGRASHDFELGPNHYIRPLIDLGFTRVDRESFNEKGAGGANLNVQGEINNFTTLQPAVEIGGEIGLTSGTLVRPYARVGATLFLNNNDHEITATLQGAPESVAPFTITTESDSTYADVSLGVDIISKKGFSYRAVYVGQFSENSSSNYVGFKFGIPF
jgi:uncharacterized protein with beta-barrel porin domain